MAVSRQQLRAWLSTPAGIIEAFAIVVGTPLCLLFLYFDWSDNGSLTLSRAAFIVLISYAAGALCGFCMWFSTFKSFVARLRASSFKRDA